MMYSKQVIENKIKILQCKLERLNRLPATFKKYIYVRQDEQCLRAQINKLKLTLECIEDLDAKI